MSASNSNTRGPFHADELRPGDRYELSNGHPIYCLPAGARHAHGNIVGALPLATDPAVESAGIDAGFSPTPHILRAPDIAVGGVPNEPGWIRGAPPLAVEYADTGTDEADLKLKIHELLTAGTEHVWIVRLVGPRRVEVHRPNEPVRTVSSGDVLVADGILKNPVPVDALYDRDKAYQATFQNLLERQGYASLDAVRAEGREEGREEATAQAILHVLAARNLVATDEQKARILACRDPALLDAWLTRAATEASVDALFA
ncbi:Uma2 family endonuclease [Pendulispora albinea]|uniref:Uma2 family endonuclease n=1 Tax=Pendulispora albinea TaxID=2741071 RepID=A0ABZ2LP42_9BACT